MTSSHVTRRVVIREEEENIAATTCSYTITSKKNKETRTPSSERSPPGKPSANPATGGGCNPHTTRFAHCMRFMGLTCQIQLLANLAERMNPNATTVVSGVTGQSLVQNLPEQLQQAWPLGETHPTRTRFTQRGKGPARANDQKGPLSQNMLLPHRHFPQE